MATLDVWYDKNTLCAEGLVLRKDPHELHLRVTLDVDVDLFVLGSDPPTIVGFRIHYAQATLRRRLELIQEAMGQDVVEIIKGLFPAAEESDFPVGERCRIRALRLSQRMAAHGRQAIPTIMI